MDENSDPAPPRGNVMGELARLFLRLGATAFGGPAAHIAMMEDEVVTRRKWMTKEEFLDLLGATNMIPGPNSTEMAILVGHRRGGFTGLLVAGSCFILPAVLIVAAIAWAYVRFGTLPQAEGLLYGVKPVVIAVIVQALWRLGRSALKTRWLIAVAIASVALGFAGVNELAIIFGAGGFVALCRFLVNRHRPSTLPVLAIGIVPALSTTTTAAVAAGAATPFGLLPLMLFFMKVGAVLFGSGYVLVAFLRADLVENWGWLTESQLLDAVAVGQLTPGPVFTTATFIGYILGGPAGAAAATVGIFVPAFFFVAISGPIIPKLRRSPTAGAVLDGVNVGSLAIMAVVTVQLAHSSLIDPLTIALALLSAVALLRFRMNSAWLILLGGLAGLLWEMLGVT
jgi:chromate transporter